MSNEMNPLLGSLAKDPKSTEDFTKEAEELIARADNMRTAGRLEEAVEEMLVLEKKTRTSCDGISTAKILCKICQLYYDAKEWAKLKEQIVTLAKKRGQLKRAITDMVLLAMGWLDALDKEQKLDLIGTLNEVTDGKIFVEVEKARLTKMMAEMKEAEGNIEEAANLLQEVQVESFGAMEKREKTEYIMNQMRLVLAKKDYVRTQIISKKINPKLLEQEDVMDLKIEYYQFMVRYWLHEKQFLDVAKSYMMIFRTKSVQEDEAKWMPVLTAHAIYLTLSPYNNEQDDMLHRIDTLEKKKLDKLDLLHLLLHAQVVVLTSHHELYNLALPASSHVVNAVPREVTMAKMVLSLALGLLELALLSAVLSAQKIGTHVAEQHPEMPLWTCSALGDCTKETLTVVMDSNWRWIHDGQYTNCFKDGAWDAMLCPDPDTCSSNCHLEGVSIQEYSSTYGVHAVSDGLTLDFVTATQYGENYGSRLYMMEDAATYKMFHLKNREFTFTVDSEELRCGMNGALYFVEMQADGGLAKSSGKNEAGAAYGTGYCDAQCPHDLKFIEGEANIIDWNSTSNPPVGHYGACCAEMDVWEANSRATAYTPHPCNITGLERCEGVACGDKNERYDGVCDKDGCDFNSWRLGDREFFGNDGTFRVNSARPVTLVTQFITHDGTDSGDLVDIRRFYVQDRKVIQNSEASMAGVSGDSVTDQLCADLKSASGDTNDFERKGGLKVMGEALDRGMVLVFSLWDDSVSDMLWLDSDFPATANPTDPGVSRGPCDTTSGKPKFLRATYPEASVTFSEVKVGAIGSTESANRRLGEWFV
ncbi:unnamed protein product [Polarella glacialis]|uniref:cellulase n=2 Tax=Polarella glacialis TaxID=89957 RepID=A0A813G6P8_POLGL|nr:unnamed protein product [Polarella glacialis]